MAGSQLSNSRKRKPTGHRQLPSPPSSKRQKTAKHSRVGYVYPTGFWDSLSKIWLTKYALREFDSRRTLSSSANITKHRPHTRQSKSDFDSSSTSAITHSKDIKRFARRGGPDLSDLIVYAEPSCSPYHTMSSNHASSYRSRGPSSGEKSKSTAKTTPRTGSDSRSSTKRSQPKDPNFVQRLNDSNVYHYGYRHPDGSKPPRPADWEELNEKLARYRASLSPSAFSMRLYQNFVDKDAEADGEDEVKDTVIPAMLAAMGATDGAKKNVLFNNLEPLADGISPPKPDYYYGAHPKQLAKQVRENEELGKYIVPSTATNMPIAPNFFLEAKGPKGSTREALLQVCHDGAIGARAIRSLQSYRKRAPVYDNRISAISSTYHAGTLKMYGHSIRQPHRPEMLPEYNMHQIKGWSMTSDRETFLQGATAFKNALDFTKEHRDVAVSLANQIAAEIGNPSKEERDNETDLDDDDQSDVEENSDGEDKGDEANERNEEEAFDLLSSFASTSRTSQLETRSG